MNIALCAEFLEEDIWGNFLCLAALPNKVEITGSNTAQALLSALERKQFSLVAVVLNGEAGLKAVCEIRKKAPDLPLLWISDEDFSLMGYKYRATYFLHKPVTDFQMRDAVARCLKFGRKV